MLVTGLTEFVNVNDPLIAGVISAIMFSNVEVFETLALILGPAVSILAVPVLNQTVLVDDGLGALFVVE